jgi:integrase
VQTLTNVTLRDYLLLILFTGLRRQEAAQLQWEQVDLKAKTLTIIDTKNRESHTLPLSDYLYDLIVARKQNNSKYVFPGAGKGGYIIEPRKQMAKVTEVSNIPFTVHDLRRTFISRKSRYFSLRFKTINES